LNFDLFLFWKLQHTSTKNYATNMNATHTHSFYLI
jgi:hypothetical protein